MSENAWIEHDGGECPVDGDPRVRVRLRCGDELSVFTSEVAWDHLMTDADFDVVAYRLSGPSA